MKNITFKSVVKEGMTLPSTVKQANQEQIKQLTNIHGDHYKFSNLENTGITKIMSGEYKNGYAETGEMLEHEGKLYKQYISFTCLANA